MLFLIASWPYIITRSNYETEMELLLFILLFLSIIFLKDL